MTFLIDFIIPQGAFLRLVLHLHSQSSAGKMSKDNSNLDVESTDYEQRLQSELDPLIQRDVKLPTKQEAHAARAQFLALCWTMFLIGWTSSSTGPLLLRIQIFYDVSRHIRYSSDYFLTSLFFRSGLKQRLGYLFYIVRSVTFNGDIRCCGDYVV